MKYICKICNYQAIFSRERFYFLLIPIQLSLILPLPLRAGVGSAEPKIPLFFRGWGDAFEHLRYHSPLFSSPVSHTHRARRQWGQKPARPCPVLPPGPRGDAPSPCPCHQHLAASSWVRPRHGARGTTPLLLAEKPTAAGEAGSTVPADAHGRGRSGPTASLVVNAPRKLSWKILVLF